MSIFVAYLSLLRAVQCCEACSRGKVKRNYQERGPCWHSSTALHEGADPLRCCRQPLRSIGRRLHRKSREKDAGAFGLNCSNFGRRKLSSLSMSEYEVDRLGVFSTVVRMDSLESWKGGNLRRRGS